MKTAEEIIISKRFFELSSSEKEVVKEYASNEEDYEAMRWFLISTRDSFNENKIEPSADLRKGVLAHLQQKPAAPKTIWLNGAGAFLFPSEKRFYRFPAFQIAAVAAVIVTVVLIYNNNPMQPELAVNDQHITPVPPEESAVISSGSDDQTAVVEKQTVEAPDAPADAVAGKEFPATEVPELERAGDAVSSDAYYRELSVAEEVKLSNNLDELEDIPAVQQSQADQKTNVNSGIYNVASSDRLGTGTTLKKAEEQKNDGVVVTDNKESVSRNEAYKTEDSTGKRDRDDANTTLPAGPVVTVTGEVAENDKDTEKNYRSTTFGGGYVDSTVTTSTSVADEEEQSAVKFSITETKALKKLFFIVK
ncbi:MAG: hypothetical protein HYZ14_03315 [Bacteroidetes bacterium]|nr:hypothetical protein [Bacteroidota bacterium]